MNPLIETLAAVALDDLRRRIDATRWPDKETVADQSQGAQLAKLQELSNRFARHTRRSR